MKIKNKGLKWKNSKSKGWNANYIYPQFKSEDKIAKIESFVPNWLSYIQLIRKLKVEGPKWNFDIQSIEIGGLNWTKLKLIYKKLGPKTQFKVKGLKCKVKINGGLSCTLTCRRKRRRGWRLQPASAASTGTWCVHAPLREEDHAAAPRSVLQ